MASFGEELKRERELRGISLKEIAEATKISIRFLEALEQDKFELLPGGIFNRGFIRAYTRFIGVDGEEMVNAYMEQVAAQQAQRRELGRPPAAAAQPAAPARPAAASRPAKQAPVRPATLPKRVTERPHPELSLRAVVRRLGELTEGRTSLILWGLALTAFVIGAAVIALSLMRSNGVASPVTETVARHDPPPAPDPAITDGSAGSQGVQPGAHDAAVDANALLPAPEQTASVPAAAPVAAIEKPSVEIAARRENRGPFVSRPSDEPLQATDMGPPPSSGGGDSTQAPPAEKVHALTVVASEITRVRIECGGRVALFQELWPGQEAALRCAEPVVLSADNAGAVQYALGGGTPALLGAPGQRVEATTIAPVARPVRKGAPTR